MNVSVEREGFRTHSEFGQGLALARGGTPLSITMSQATPMQDQYRKARRAGEVARCRDRSRSEFTYAWSNENVMGDAVQKVDNLVRGGNEVLVHRVSGFHDSIDGRT
jgi:hypothetical protein